MLRTLISFVCVFVTLGGGNLVAIAVVKRLDAPLLVFPAVVLIVAATLGVGFITAPGGSASEKLARLSKSLTGSQS